VTAVTSPQAGVSRDWRAGELLSPTRARTATVGNTLYSESLSCLPFFLLFLGFTQRERRAQGDGEGEADAEIRIIDEWWREKRCALRSSSSTSSLTPSTRSLEHRTSGVLTVGRLWQARAGCCFERRGHHVYYTPGDRELIVLAIWHAERGTGPLLAPGRG
jgi:hypothetical protein